MSGYFVTGIGTEIGKTVVSAILVKSLGFDYWKPVQAGDLHFTDTQKVQNWVGQGTSRFFPERYRLNTPASPHYAASLDGLSINIADFQVPNSERGIIVEGAGGLMVPLNEKDLMLDLIKHLRLPVVVVARHYLGSINHSLLTIAMLQQHQIPIAALIFNGPATPSTSRIIEQMSGIKALFELEEMSEINTHAIAAAAQKHGLAIAQLK